MLKLMKLVFILMIQTTICHVAQQLGGSMKVIFEDNHLLVVEKPINVPMQEDSSKDEDLLTMCKKYIKEKLQSKAEISKPDIEYQQIDYRPFLHNDTSMLTFKEERFTLPHATADLGRITLNHTKP